MRALIGAASAVAVAGCALYPIAYQLTPTGSGALAPKAADCDFVLVTTKLDRPYEEIGILDATLNPARTASEFKTTVREHVCAAGGDAVIASVNGVGHYVKGAVLRWRESSKAPESPAPSP